MRFPYLHIPILTLTSGLCLLCLSSAVMVEAAGTERPQADTIHTDAVRASAAFFDQSGETDVTPLTRLALTTFLEARQLYQSGRFQECQGVLDALWRRYPAGTQAWSTAQGLKVFNLGLPHCYPALLMLTDCCRWRLNPDQATVRAREITLGVVLFGHSQGVQPRNRAELAEGTGAMVTHDLNPTLLVNDNKLIYDALWEFGEYIQAISSGRLKLKVQITYLPDVVIPVRTTTGPTPGAMPDWNDFAAFWPAVLRQVKTQPDWWWRIYPSHVPETFEDFKHAEFITGGMGPGADGISPCFEIDDRWLVRRPPHLGTGKYSDIEIAAYLPMWLQHEFFHHLFGRYTEFGLEKTSHQWHDRSKWPADFAGLFESDYYREAMEKRLKPQGNPPLQAKLQYAPPPAALLATLKPQAIVGRYRHTPVENGWLEGTISLVGKNLDGAPLFTWENAAHISWSLVPKFREGYLETGPENPYFKTNTCPARKFTILLKRNADGQYLPEVVGFSFNGAVYLKEP